jgi:hypothetical protein
MGLILLLFVAPLVVSLAGMVSGILLAINSPNRGAHRAGSFLPLVASVAPFVVMTLAAFLLPTKNQQPVGGEGFWLLAMVVVPLALAIWSAKVMKYNVTQFLLHVLGPPISGLLLVAGCIYLAALAATL